MERLVYDEGVELFRYIYKYYGTLYFSDLQVRALSYDMRRAKYEADRQWWKSQGVEPSELNGGSPDPLDPGEMDPDVALELRNGFWDFMQRTGFAAFRDHGAQMTIPRCRKCSALLRAPNARQCVWCGHSWFHAT